MRTIGSLATAVLAAAVFWVGAVGCNKKTSGRDLVLIEASKASTLMQGHTGLLGLAGLGQTAVVDPRIAEEFNAGHLPGAINMPFQTVSVRYRELQGYDVVVVYGADFDDPKAEAMSKRLLELRIKDVRTLRGGVRA